MDNIDNLINKVHKASDLLVNSDDMSWVYYMLLNIVVQKYNPDTSSKLTIIKRNSDGIFKYLNLIPETEETIIIISLLRTINKILYSK